MADEERHGAPDRRVAIATFLVSLCAAAAVGFVTGRFRPVGADQPIAFNHRKHVVENQIDCSTCHAFYETQAFSGLPDIETCATCHEQAQGKTAEEAKLVRLVQKRQPLQWAGLFQQPAHVFYSHRTHVVKAQIKCERCHGDFAATTSPPQKVRRLKMQDCVDCHVQRRVAVDCTTCHR